MLFSREKLLTNRADLLDRRLLQYLFFLQISLEELVISVLVFSLSILRNSVETSWQRSAFLVVKHSSKTADVVQGRSTNSLESVNDCNTGHWWFSCSGTVTASSWPVDPNQLSCGCSPLSCARFWRVCPEPEKEALPTFTLEPSTATSWDKCSCAKEAIFTMRTLRRIDQTNTSWDSLAIFTAALPTSSSRLGNLITELVQFVQLP